jgi:biopolymer transport protein ExbB
MPVLPRPCIGLHTRWLILLAFATASAIFAAAPAAAQNAASPAKPADGGPSAKAPDKADLEFKKMADAADKENAAAKPQASAAPVDATQKAVDINWFEMFWSLRYWLIPFLLMSFVVLAFTIERCLGLRRNKILPRKLIKNLGALASNPGGFDPRKAYRVCQQIPCSASNVVRAMLLKVGRPTDEVEKAVTDAIERENWRLNYNVRPIALAVTVSPLMGLLFTVLGMMIVFYATAKSPIGADRAVVLAEGIYLKLGTTFAGLAVAIPSLFVAYYFEGRIQRLLRETEDLAHNLLPQVEKFEGKLRTTRGTSSAIEPPPVAKFAPEPAVTPDG